MDLATIATVLFTYIIVLGIIAVTVIAVTAAFVILPVIAARRAFARFRRRYVPQFRPGQISEGFRFYYGTMHRRSLERTLRRVLPKWPVSAKLVAAAGELADLRAGLNAAAGAGVTRGILLPIEEETEIATAAIWRIADRVSAAAAHNVSYQLLAPGLEPEIEQLTNLVLAVRQAREGLAQLTLAHEESRELVVAERHFRALGEATTAVLRLAPHAT